MPTVQLVIKGKVQGVFYRATAREQAEVIGIKGWIGNTVEGDVEAMVSGSEEQINRFIEWCRKGPERAIVTDVNVTAIPDQNFETFKVIRGGG
jgi:acylphosphatase